MSEMTTNPHTQQQPNPQTTNPARRRDAHSVVVVLALFLGLLGGLLIRAPFGCAPTDKEVAPDAETEAHGEHDHENDRAEHEHGEHAQQDGHTDDLAAHGPEGSTLLENTHCPVMGGPIDEAHGVEFNGWWVYFCCPGCDETFLGEPDAYAAALKEQTGIDVRLTPREAEQAAAWPEGPNGTRDLQNERDPVSGEPSRAHVGVEVSGWWVRLASPASIRTFVRELDRYAATLHEATGIDVRQAPDAQSTLQGDDAGQEEQAQEEQAQEESGAAQDESDVVIELGNERCPVMDNPVAEDEYVVYNGWRIRFCCPGCDGMFLDDPERYAQGLEEQTGHDIRVPAE